MDVMAQMVPEDPMDYLEDLDPGSDAYKHKNRPGIDKFIRIVKRF